MQKTKRPLSFLLAVLMIVSMFAAAPFTASAETIYNTADEDIEARDLRVGDILASPGAWKEYTIRGNHEYQLVLEGGGYFYDGILQTEDYVFSEDESPFRFRGDFFDDVPDDVPVVNDFYAPADKDGIVTDKWYVIGTENNKITISGKGFVITPCDMETLDFTKHSGGFVGNCCIVSPGSETDIDENENAWEWWFDGDYSLQEMGVTISSLLESDIRKVVVYTESHWNNFWNGTPIAVVGDTTLTYTRDGNAFTFDNVDAASVVISATGGSGIKITKIDVYYVDTDPDVENVIALIDAIGTVAYTAESKAKIDDARAAYDDLTADQQALVTNADTLTAAEAAYALAKITWNGTVPTSAPSGFDETASPITLDTVEEFVWFFNRVGNGTNFSGKTVVLTTDIDLAGHDFGDVWSVPGSTFNGTFDGQDHTVSNFTFSSGEKAYRWSLFRNVKDAAIKNLTLDNVNVGTGTGTGHAALVGMTQGTVAIENVHIGSGSVSGGSAVGGVVGQNKASILTVKNCSNAATINATNRTAGGIIGASTNDSNDNTAITVENCTNTGAVTAANGYASGIYGAIEPTTARPTVKFKDCANEGTLTAANGSTDDICACCTGSMSVTTTETDAVIAKIDAIGTVEYTDACKAKIDAARAAYDGLTAAQKELVSNYTTLTDAETAYAALAPAPKTYNGITFQPWTATDSLPTSGNWYLTGNVTPGSHCVINDASAPLSLLLNGQTIDLSNGVVIGLMNGATFNLYDEDNTGVITGGTGSNGYGAAVYGQDGTFNMYGGTITGCSANSGGGAVLLMNTSAFNMYGGVITGNYGSYGGGVYVYSGTFTMYDGTISNNTGYYGGGILVDQNGTFVMNGGTITGNTGYYYGGGISSYGTVRITGNCPITYNTAGYGGGGIELENGGKLYMNGGVVSFNRVSNQDGGMYKGGGLHVPNGSECHLQGNVQITNNYQGSNGETPNNMFVRTEALGKVFLDAQLTDGASIGVGTNAQAGGTFTGSENTNYNDAGKFTSDSASYIIGKNAAGQLLLGAPCTVTFVDGNGTELQSGQIAYGAACVYNGDTPAKADDAQYTYTFSGWTDGETTYAPDAIPAATGDVIYTATFTPQGKPFSVKVKKLTGEVYTIQNVTRETTVAELKTLVATETAIPASEQRLIFAGKQLEDDKTLGEYNIGKDATLQLVVRTYTVTWMNGETVLETSTGLSAGDIPSYPGETPTKDADAQYTYTFSGWTDGTNSYGLTDTLPAVTGNVTYTAKFTQALTPAAALAQAKTDAKDALDSYKNADDYRAAEQADLADAITAGKEAIDAAADTDAVATALANAKAAIDAIKTDAQLTDEELATAKTNATSTVNAVNAADYIAADQQTVTNAKNTALAAIEAATTVAQVNAVINAFNTAIEDCTTQVEEYAQDWMSVRIDDQIYIKYILRNREGLESVTVTYYDQDGVKVLQEQSYTVDQLTFGADGTFVILAEVAPAQIGDTVTVTITTSDGNPPTTYETSIADYCRYLIANYDDENVTNLAKALLEYGQAANDYFAGTGFYNASEITTITEAVKQANIDAAKAQNNLATTGDISNMLAGASFMALTKPEFRFYFNDSLTDEKAAQLNENEQITTNDDDVTAMFYKNPETGAILLEVKGIKAEDMDKVITITVGDLGTITFSGNDFARMMAGSSNQSIATLGTALYLYGKAAKDCFSTNQEG